MSKQFQSAECYSGEASKFQRDTGYQFLQRLSPISGSRVLDLGCGTGYLAAKLSGCVGPEGSVIAVDPDGERLKIAKEKYARDNIEYVSGDAATFPEGPYDLVFANQVVHWVADKDALFERVYQSLKSRGRFAFTTPNGHPVWPSVAKNCVGELFGPDYLDYLYEKRMFLMTFGQYEELALSHGFVVMSMEIKEVPGLRTPSVDDLIAFFFGMMQGEMDQDAISKQTVKKCKEKYDEDLYKEAVLPPKKRMLQVVLSKP